MKNLPVSRCPDMVDIVFVYSDDDIDLVDVTASNDNLSWAAFRKTSLKTDG